MMARWARMAVETAVKAAAAGIDVLRPPARGLVVLIYHRVGGRAPISVDLPVTMFDAQMAWLSATLPVVTLDEGLAWLSAPDREPAGEVRVAVTFDDGTADFVDEALPVLVRHRVPVTLYVATDFVERQIRFPHDGVPITWRALRDACSTGLVQVGSHTHRHALLDRLPPDRIPGELDRSIELVADRLGAAPRHFAYPKAVPGSAAADAAVRARFVSAALAGGRANRPGADPHRLSRTPVQVGDGDTWFPRKARGGLAFEETLRRVVRRARYSGATT